LERAKGVDRIWGDRSYVALRELEMDAESPEGRREDAALETDAGAGIQEFKAA